MGVKHMAKVPDKACETLLAGLQTNLAPGKQLCDCVCLYLEKRIVKIRYLGHIHQ